MLELRNVSKRFSGSLAVDDVSFCARPGEVTGYLGPNGSGKSTTMKMIVGLIDTPSGEIEDIRAQRLPRIGRHAQHRDVCARLRKWTDNR